MLATREAGFPITPNAFQTTHHSGGPLEYDAFLTELNSAGSGLIYSSYLGGSGEDGATGVAMDAVGDVFVTGTTFPPEFGRIPVIVSPPGAPSGNLAMKAFEQIPPDPRYPQDVPAASWG